MLRCVWVLLLFASGVYHADTCPPDVRETASQCSGPYISNYDSVETNRGRLYSGIDIEELRLLCRFFKQMRECFLGLDKACSGTASSILNAELEGVADIHEICSKDRFIDEYAMEHFCLSRNKAKSDECYDDYTKNTSGLMYQGYKGNNYAVRQICSYSTAVTECISKNIHDNCNPKAAELVEQLVRPTLKLGDIQCQLIDAQVTTASPITTSATDSKQLSVYSGQSNLAFHRTLLLVLFGVWRTIL